MSAARLLILDTSHAQGFVGLAQGNDVIAVHTLDEARRHARDLAPTVGALLAGAGWRPGEIDAVAVSQGPGSYTGLRIGIMSAKTFCFATSARLIALETFQAIALQADASIDRLAVIADAQQDKLYIQTFARREGNLDPVAPLAIAPFAAWCLTAAEPLHISGPGLVKWAAHLPAHLTPVDDRQWYPTAQTMARSASARLAAGRTDDFWTIEPIYLRPSAAEEQWDRKKGPDRK